MPGPPRPARATAFLSARRGSTSPGCRETRTIVEGGAPSVAGMLLRMRPTDRDPDRAELTRVGTVVTVGSDFIHDRAQRFAVGKVRHNANFARVPRGRRRR